jgi:hypothetical protein
MIARGERPLFHIRASGSGPNIEVRIKELPWLVRIAARPSHVQVIGRVLVAEWLDVEAAAFDLTDDD